MDPTRRPHQQGPRDPKIAHLGLNERVCTYGQMYPPRPFKHSPEDGRPKWAVFGSKTGDFGVKTGDFGSKSRILGSKSAFLRPKTRKNGYFEKGSKNGPILGQPKTPSWDHLTRYRPKGPLNHVQGMPPEDIGPKGPILGVQKGTRSKYP